MARGRLDPNMKITPKLWQNLDLHFINCNWRGDFCYSDNNENWVKWAKSSKITEASLHTSNAFCG